MSFDLLGLSEELLKAIIRLLVIVAKEEGEVDESEKDALRDFLYENVSRDDTRHYLKILDEYVNEIETGDGKDDHTQITEITTNINNELTQQQKLVVMVRLQVKGINMAHPTSHEKIDQLLCRCLVGWD